MHPGLRKFTMTILNVWYFMLWLNPNPSGHPNAQANQYKVPCPNGHPKGQVHRTIFHCQDGHPNGA